MSINADWEKFMGGPVRPSQADVHVTISWKGLITFNTRAAAMMGNPEAVTLFFNRREQKIGMKGSSPRFFEAFPIKKYGRGDSTRYVNAAAFLRHYGIKITETHKFNRPDLAGEGMLVLSLNDTTVVSRSRGKRKKDDVW